MIKILLISFILFTTAVVKDEIKFDGTQSRLISSFEKTVGQDIALPKYLPFKVKKIETSILGQDNMEIRYHGYQEGIQILLHVSEENPKTDRIKHYEGAPYARKVILQKNIPAIILNKEFKMLSFTYSGMQYTLIDFTGRNMTDNTMEQIANSLF